MWIPKMMMITPATRASTGRAPSSFWPRAVAEAPRAMNTRLNPQTNASEVMNTPRSLRAEPLFISCSETPDMKLR